MIDNDLELEKIFSRHVNNETIMNKKEVQFDNNTVNENKKTIELYRNNNLIKENHHFSLENDDMEIETDNETNAYFKDVVDNTIKNDSLYCSYLDYFDKMWMKNKISDKSKNI